MKSWIPTLALALALYSPNLSTSSWAQPGHEGHDHGVAAPTAVPAGAPAAPASAANPGKASKIKFLSITHNFGTVTEGPQVTHKYKFQNTGNADLLITGVHPACGCTAADYTKEAVPPGGSGHITLAYATQGRPGQATKTATVNTNDPANATLTLTFQVNVVRDIEITPQDQVYLFGVKKGTAQDRAVTILAKAGVPFKVLSFEVTNKKVTAALQPHTENGRQGAILSVNLPADTPIGEINDQIILKTSSKKKPEILLAVRGEVLGRVQVIPKQVNFGAALDQSVTLTIMADPPQGFVIRSVSSDKSTAKPWVNKTRRQDGVDQYSVVVSLSKPKSLPPGPVEDTVTIITNDAEQGEIKVPVLGTKNP